MNNAGFTTRKVAENYQKKTGSRTVTRMAGHWFETVQWTLPTEENYKWLQELFNYEHLKKEYDELKKEYDELKKEYDELRRTFTISADVPYTDVWDFKAVLAYEGKHPCEKPQNLLKHIIEASSKEGDLILDPFAGSGSTAEACMNTNRRFIIIEQDEGYCKKIINRLENHQPILF